MPDGAAVPMMAVSLCGMASPASTSTTGGNMCGDSRGKGPAPSRRHPTTTDAGQRHSWMFASRPLPCTCMVPIRAINSGWWIW